MSSRGAAAAILGCGAGLTAFVGLVLAGVLLYQRLAGDSVVALVIFVAIFGLAGAYAGWLLGVIVYSGVRGAGLEATVEPGAAEDP